MSERIKTTAFKKIGLIGKHENPEVKETLQLLIQFLTKEKISFYVEHEAARQLENKEICILPHDELPKHSDLLIVIGGDGCMLSAARLAAEHQIPIVGINKGKLGFLTDIRPDEIETKLLGLLQGHYFEEKRFLLDIKDEKKFLRDIALNEAVLTSGSTAQMIGFEVWIDHLFMCSYSADGIIIATPTGSTAYALSAGGPILHPDLDAIILIPMFSHSLTSRPIVINGDKKVTLHIYEHNKNTPRLSCDGKKYKEIPLGTRIHIQKSEKQLRLAHPIGHDYFEILRSKLHWGKRLP